MKYIRVFLILGLVMQCTAKQKVEQKEVELQNIYNQPVGGIKIIDKFI